MAWLPSSCHAVHRRLRIPDLRKGRDSPLSTRPPPCHQTASPSRRLSTPRIPRSDLNATCQTRSLLSVSSSPVPSLAACSDVLAASVKHGIWFYDTVRIAGCPETREAAELPRRLRHGSANPVRKSNDSRVSSQLTGDAGERGVQEIGR